MTAGTTPPRRRRTGDAGHSTSGTRIRRCRSRLGITQRDLAARSQMSQSTLSRVERNKRAPRTVELMRLADALGCPVSEISEHATVRDRLLTHACSHDAHLDRHDPRHPQDAADMASERALDVLRVEVTRMLELDARLDEYDLA